MKRIITIGLIFVSLTVVAFNVAPVLNVGAQSAATSERCTVSKPRILTQNDKVEAANEAHADAYADLQSRVEALVTSATTQKYDKVSALSTASKNFTTKVTDFTNKSTSYSAALKTAADAACGESESTYTTSLTAARTSLTATRTSATAVKTDFTSKVVPSLKDYATWLKAEAAKVNPSQETN